MHGDSLARNTGYRSTIHDGGITIQRLVDDKKLVEMPESFTLLHSRKKLARYKPYAQARVLLVLTSFDTRVLVDMDLYVDGNIAQMSGPESAARYFARLLGVDARSLHPTVTQDWPYAFFITSPAVQTARPHLDVSGRPLDYAISQAGTVVPQSMWSPGNPADGQRYANVPLHMPIFFVPLDRVILGLPLLRAVEGGHANIQGANDTAPIGSSSTMYIRIKVSAFSFSEIAYLVWRNVH